MQRDEEYLRVHTQRARAKKAGAPATLTVTDWRQTIKDFNGLCAYCQKRPFDVLEHFLACDIAGTTINNCIPACINCNMRKRDLVGEALESKFGIDVIQRVKQYLDTRVALALKDPPVVKVITPHTPRQNFSSRDAYQVLTDIQNNLGVPRHAMKQCISELAIKKHKFWSDPRHFVTKDDAKRIKKYFKDKDAKYVCVKKIKEVRDKPWLLNKEREK